MTKIPETKNFTLYQGAMFDETVQLLASTGLNRSVYTHSFKMDIRSAVRAGTLLQRLSTENGGIKHYGSDLFGSDAVSEGEIYETFLLDAVLDDFAGPDGVLKLYLHDFQTDVFTQDQLAYDLESVPMHKTAGATIASVDITIDADAKTVTAAAGGLSVFHPYELVRFDWAAGYSDDNDATYYRIVTATDTVLTFDRELASDVLSEETASFLSAGLPIQIRAAAKSFQPGITEKLTEGDFATVVNWDAGDGTWVLSTGAAVATASTAAVSQLIPTLKPSTFYELTYTLSGCTVGTVTPQITDTGAHTSSYSARAFSATVNGTYRESIISVASLDPTTAKFQFLGAGFTGTIDNVTLKEVHEYGTLNVTANNGSDRLVIEASEACFSGTVNELELFTAQTSLARGSSFLLSGGNAHDGHYRVYSVTSTRIVADRISLNTLPATETASTDYVITITKLSNTERVASGVITVGGKTTD